MNPEIEVRLSRLPSPVADAVRRALEQPDAADAVEEAFRAVEFPEGRPFPLPDALTGPQRALAEIVALSELEVGGAFAVPSLAADQRRWLGLEPAGVLEEPVTYTLDGQERTAPLWHALQSLQAATGASRDYSTCAALLNSFPLAKRLRVFDALLPTPPKNRSVYGLNHIALEEGLQFIDEGEGPAWAAASADALLEKASSIARHNPQVTLAWCCEHRLDFRLRLRAFAALVREQVAIESRWDVLLPLPSTLRGDVLKDVLPCIRAIPEERRDSAIRSALEGKFPTEIVVVGTALLDEFPSEPLLELILRHVDESHRPKREVLKDLAAIAQRHSQLRDRFEAYIAKQPPPLMLRCERTITPKTQEELSPVEREQLLIACANWDGNEVPLEQRLPPTPQEATPEDAQREECVAGVVDLYKIDDEQGQPAYDAFVFLHDDGTVFRAGTTQIVATMIQGSLMCRDHRLNEALHAVIHAAATSS